jgi:hypothetical protein
MSYPRNPDGSRKLSRWDRLLNRARAAILKDYIDQFKGHWDSIAEQLEIDSSQVRRYARKLVDENGESLQAYAARVRKAAQNGHAETDA